VSEFSYCDCDYDGDTPDFIRIRMIKRARKPHKCYECGGIIFVGESYERIDALFEGSMHDHSECTTCLEIRQWASISVPCFCAYEWGSLLERVMEMVSDVAPMVDGFILEWDERRYQLALRKMQSRMVKGLAL
jgi:hypothetical protein